MNSVVVGVLATPAEAAPSLEELRRHARDQCLLASN